MQKIDIKNLISFDETGMPKLPTLEQLIDKDVRILFTRDKTKDKERYFQECIVIYYLADPNSPPRQKGYSDKECIRDAIENAGLPADYQPDLTVLKIAKKYSDNCITEAGLVLNNILKAIHNANVAIDRLNEILNNKLSSGISDEDASVIIDILDNLSKKAVQIPSLVKGLNEAYENVVHEKEQTTARGGLTITSSMSADDN